MKRLIAFSFCVFAFSFFSICCAQDSTKTRHKPKSLSIVFGQGRPLGSFNFENASSNSPLIESKGYTRGNSFADPGGLFDVDFCIPIKKSSFGFILHFGYNGNGFDNDRFSNLYLPQKTFFQPTNSTTFYSTSSAYSIITLLPGITYTCDFRKFFFGIKVLAGPLFCSGPDISYIQLTPYNLEPFRNMFIPTSAETKDSIISNPEMSLCMEVGLEAGYHFCKKVYFLIGCDYLYAEPMISITTKSFYDYGGQLSTGYDYEGSTLSIHKIPISLLNIYAGFKFLL